MFGMGAIRAPARFSVLTLLAIAVLSAIAIRAIELRTRRVRPLIAIALVVIASEYSNAELSLPAPPALTSHAGQWLREQPESGAVICVPMGLFDGNTPCMLQSLEHRRPVVNGYSGIRPPFFETLVDEMSRIPSPGALMALHDLGVEYIVSNGPLTIDAAFAEAVVERARFADQTVYQLVWSPALESRLSAATEVIPPDPGPLSFAVGEAATYRVRWTSGPLDVPAGQATISAVAPHGSERFRFQVVATTAVWVSRFYEANVRLESAADDRILPLRYTELVDEGVRRTERQLDFDFGRREVRLTSGGTPITLPLSAQSRDPVSALFFVRTLPISTGATFALPVNDNGRRLTLHVNVIGRESMTLDGRTWDAWKLEPRVSDRIDRDPLAITAWVSADARRIPLVIEVSAGFGSVRVELTSYREN
jgi:hypothetical protein